MSDKSLAVVTPDAFVQDVVGVLVLYCESSGDHGCFKIRDDGGADGIGSGVFDVGAHVYLEIKFGMVFLIVVHAFDCRSELGYFRSNVMDLVN